MALPSTLLAVAAAFLMTAASQAQNLTGFKGCDALIAAGLSDRVYVSTDAEYGETIKSYWSGTVQALEPWCIVKPVSTEEVSRAVAALSGVSPAGNWDVALRSGGHSSWPSNNVARGVTIDLSYINATVFREEEGGGIASIGTGARWASVFAEVERYGRSVTGGREGNVGVGGLLLGGGVSFYSGKRGFACDDVVNYEVVLADGSVVQASDKENPNLFKALKGGGNNFGVVTRFDMRAFEQGNLYGGLLVYAYDKRAAVFNQFHPEDTELVTLSYTSPGPAPMIAIVAINTDGHENSTSFAPLTGVEAVIDERGVKSYGRIITDYQTAGGRRSVWFSFCFQNDIEVMNHVADEFVSFIDKMENLVPGTNFSLHSTFQPLPKHYVKNIANNVLGLDQSLGHDSIIYLIWISVDTLEQETLFYNKLASMTAKLEADIESRGASTSWKYMNYINPSQDPIATYGETNVAYLKEVAAQYDPIGFFQDRVPGGFKIIAENETL
ncbi:hypothetical protein TruAng_009967 [Truncatella angustata]|nr:hypothetical protein TruAng_009967 [Truncatella angustata]